MNTILHSRHLSVARTPGLLQTLAFWAARHRSRRQLLALDDRLLADIGLDREAAQREARKAFWTA